MMRHIRSFMGNDIDIVHRIIYKPPVGNIKEVLLHIYADGNNWMAIHGGYFDGERMKTENGTARA